MSDCIFCRIVAGTLPARVLWENEHAIAFLTPFPNVHGFTVIATKAHLPSYITELADDDYARLWKAARTVAGLLDKALGTRRTGMIAEGMGIDHAHVKLVPMHGIPEGPWKPVNSTERTFYETYRGYIASHDGPRAAEEDLDRVLRAVRALT